MSAHGTPAFACFQMIQRMISVKVSNWSEAAAKVFFDVPRFIEP